MFICSKTVRPKSVAKSHVFLHEIIVSDLCSGSVFSMHARNKNIQNEVSCSYAQLKGVVFWFV